MKQIRKKIWTNFLLPSFPLTESNRNRGWERNPNHLLSWHCYSAVPQNFLFLLSLGVPIWVENESKNLTHACPTEASKVSDKSQKEVVEPPFYTPTLYWRQAQEEGAVRSPSSPKVGPSIAGRNCTLHSKGWHFLWGFQTPFCFLFLSASKFDNIQVPSQIPSSCLVCGFSSFLPEIFCWSNVKFVLGIQTPHFASRLSFIKKNMTL